MRDILEARRKSTTQYWMESFKRIRSKRTSPFDYYSIKMSMNIPNQSWRGVGKVENILKGSLD